MSSVDHSGPQNSCVIFRFFRGDRKCIISLMKSKPQLLNCKISCSIKFKQSPRPLCSETYINILQKMGNIQ
jgi:hypothetical protein